jgi:hypothetical protein
MRRIALAAVLAAGCIGTGSHAMRQAVPEPEARAFDACYGFVRARACTDGSPAYRDACMDAEAERFGKFPDPTSRRAYLAEAGCPSSVVDGALRR